MALLRSNKKDLAGASILDVGCGTGSILQRFFDFGVKEATGIDLMEHRIAEGRRLHPRLKLSSGDASRLPYPDDSFDLVTQFTCFSSIFDQGLRQKIAQEMWRVLKPGGCILSYDLRPQIVIGCLRNGIGKLVQRTQKNNTPIKPLSTKDLHDLFPSGALKYRQVSLIFGLAGIAEKSFLAAYFLSRISFLRSHNLVLIEKARR